VLPAARRETQCRRRLSVFTRTLADLCGAVTHYFAAREARLTRQHAACDRQRYAAVKHGGIDNGRVSP
jgi:hypothetical protein